MTTNIKQTAVGNYKHKKASSDRSSSGGGGGGGGDGAGPGAPSRLGCTAPPSPISIKQQYINADMHRKLTAYHTRWLQHREAGGYGQIIHGTQWADGTHFAENSTTRSVTQRRGAGGGAACDLRHRRLSGVVGQGLGVRHGVVGAVSGAGNSAVRRAARGTGRVRATGPGIAPASRHGTAPPPPPPPRA